MKRSLYAAATAICYLLPVAAAHAVVLCVKKSGVVVQRPACKAKRETTLDLAHVGAIGPKGDPGMQGPPGVGPLTTCPVDSLLVGTTCIDKYEASVWQIPPDNSELIQKVRAGEVTLAMLTGGGAMQLSPASSCMPSYPTTFPGDGNWTALVGSDPPTPGIYAVSIPGVPPSSCITWFQAIQACALSGKHLVRNAEWQLAAAGTPDIGTDNGTSDCNVASDTVANTGSRSSCRSNWGVFDMVGNVWEWVEEWADRADGCTDWTSQTGIAGQDGSCFGGSGAFNSTPGALMRGGFWVNGPGAGVFAVIASSSPSYSDLGVGFRCAR